MKDETVTIRDRDSTEQVRVKIEDLGEIVGKLVNKELKFKEIGELVETRKKEDGYRTN